MMSSAKEGVVFEREGTKVRDTVSQPASSYGYRRAYRDTASNDLRVEWER